jgi:hypothetical protein
MSTDNTNVKRANSVLLGQSEPAPTVQAQKKFAGSKASSAEKAPKKEEEDLETKFPFSSTITGENRRRFANYQANKPGRRGTATTDVLNAALTMFFDANKKYADKDPEDED